MLLIVLFESDHIKKRATWGLTAQIQAEREPSDRTTKKKSFVWIEQKKGEVKDYFKSAKNRNNSTGI